jgi:hypothetical protein
MSVSEELGMSRKEAAVVLKELFTRREDIEKKMAEMEKQLQPTGVSMPYIALQQQHADVEKKMDRAMNWYSVHVLENLEDETRTLRGETQTLKLLTKVLVGVTVVLAMLTGILVLGVLGKL